MRSVLLSIENGTLKAGDRLPNEHALATSLDVSRSTVHLALIKLQERGVIESGPGRGRVVSVSAGLTDAAPSDADRRGIRLGILPWSIGESDGNWYLSGLLAGLNDAGTDATKVIMHLLRQCQNDADRFAQQLDQQHPDVVAFLRPYGSCAPFVREVQRRKIPCLVTGWRLPDLGVPTIREDSAAGARDAVRRLVARGHRRIGLLVPAEPVGWVFDRKRGYEQGLKDAGIEPDGNLVHWMNISRPVSAANAEELQQYIKRAQPTALLSSSGLCVSVLGRLMQETGLRIPQDLSLISFDQDIRGYAAIFGDVKVATVALPFHEISGDLIRLTLRLAAGEEIPAITELPCPFMDGDTLAPTTQNNCSRNGGMKSRSHKQGRVSGRNQREVQDEKETTMGRPHGGAGPRAGGGRGAGEYDANVDWQLGSRSASNRRRYCHREWRSDLE